MTNKERILITRGFCRQDIKENFANYTGEWNISTLTLAEVREKQTREELMPLFAKDSVETMSFCPTYYGYDFRFFSEDIPPFKVAPSALDPHIALLCKAINEIGVKTCMSCDGWHERNGKYSQMELYMTDRYSVLWFWLITEHVFGERWDRKNPYTSAWKNIWEPFDSDPNLYLPNEKIPRDMMICKYRTDDRTETRRVFVRNSFYALFIEQHKDEFLELRRIIIDALNAGMKKGEIDNVDRTSFLAVRRYMEEVFLRHSEQLTRAFKYECRKIPSLH